MLPICPRAVWRHASPPATLGLWGMWSFCVYTQWMQCSSQARCTASGLHPICRIYAVLAWFYQPQILRAIKSMKSRTICFTSHSWGGELVSMAYLQPQCFRLGVGTNATMLVASHVCTQKKSAVETWSKLCCYPAAIPTHLVSPGWGSETVGISMRWASGFQWTAEP